MTDFWATVQQAAIDLIAHDVPGSLLILSLAVNAILLAPYVLRAFRRAWK